ncbi:hypothetical protein Dcar01_03568 [Deinococcus carri]|uniref:IrrE N-terminal-like domain-containing protein n=1 Tax=Deinococcus carri TaxID=1211323 RepID=A0ABP9WEZ5_9DEIO
MTFDPDAYDLFAYQKARHEEVGGTTDMEELPTLLGCTVIEADASRLIGTDLHVQRRLIYAGRRSHIAHEVSHKLAQERDTAHDPNYEEVIRHRHAQAPDVDAHLEALITTGQDGLLMPDKVVQTIINICGLNAMVVWILHQQETVYLHEALRRIVQHNENARIGGFIGVNGIIRHAYSYRWRMPCWIGHPVPDPDDEFQGEGVSLFQVPGRRNTVIGLIVIEE